MYTSGPTDLPESIRPLPQPLEPRAVRNTRMRPAYGKYREKVERTTAEFLLMMVSCDRARRRYNSSANTARNRTRGVQR